ncbi:MAG: hypothetical protein ACREPV_01340 [Lysobacter sp.]
MTDTNTIDRPECEAGHHGLACHLRDDALLIRLDVDTLCSAARGSDIFFDMAEGGERITITDPAAFAREVERALNDEDEQGNTPVSRMFDRAIEWVVEQGGDGLHIDLPGVAKTEDTPA